MKSLRMLALCGAMLCLVVGSIFAQPYDYTVMADDFSGGTLDPAWTVVRGTVGVSSGAMALTMGESPTWTADFGDPEVNAGPFDRTDGFGGALRVTYTYSGWARGGGTFGEPLIPNADLLGGFFDVTVPGSPWAGALLVVNGAQVRGQFNHLRGSVGDKGTGDFLPGGDIYDGVPAGDPPVMVRVTLDTTAGGVMEWSLDGASWTSLKDDSGTGYTDASVLLKFLINAGNGNPSDPDVGSTVFIDDVLVEYTGSSVPVELSDFVVE